MLERVNTESGAGVEHPADAGLCRVLIVRRHDAHQIDRDIAENDLRIAGHLAEVESFRGGTGRHAGMARDGHKLRARSLEVVCAAC